jgi:hypothetical protein
MQSIILPHCWVCRSTDGKNHHHVIPQAYGGVNGPQVTLCATHHTLIHTQALKRPDTWKPHLVKNHNAVQVEQLLQLIGLIHKARAATANTEKPIQVQHKFTKTRSRQIRELKVLLGCNSITSVLERCVDIIHAQHTQINN